MRWPNGFSFLVASLLAVLPSAGCNSGPSTSSSAVDAGPVSVATFAATFAATYCDSIVDCCRRAGYASGTCRAVVERFMTAVVTSNTSNPTLVFDETAAQRCLDAYAAALRACTDRSLAERTGSACWGMFGPSNSMQPNNALPHAALGEPCMGSCVGSSLSSSTCGTTAGGGSITAFCWIEDGVYCANGSCISLPTVGLACGAASYCGVDTWCQNQICVASAVTGGKCGRSDDCVSADYCNLATFTCAAVLANGSACSEDRDCAGGQCERGLCRAWSIATASACAGQID